MSESQEPEGQGAEGQGAEVILEGNAKKLDRSADGKLEKADQPEEAESRPSIFSDINTALFGDPWEMWIGAILISILSILLFVIESPLGSIGGINNYGQNAYNWLGLSLDSTATDGIACPGDFLYAMLVLAVFLGAAGASLFAKEFAIRIAPKPELAKGLVGGLLMGVGGSIGMGCTISGFYSSLPALSGGGLFFGLGLFIGVFFALKYLLWESGRFPSLTEGKWIRYLGEKKKNEEGGRPSWQPFAGFFVLLWGVFLISLYDPFSPTSRDLTFIGFILIGLMVGFILQRSRFCIFRAIREPFLSGDPRPAQAIISGLLVGLVGFTVIKGVGQGDEYSFIFANYWLPGLIGGTIFGIGMTSAGACSIGSTWRAAEGNVKHLLAVIGIAISMPLTTEYFTPRFLDTIPASTQQAEFLPDTIGYGGAVMLILFLLFLWYVILKWNERDGILLLIGGPDKEEPWPWPEKREAVIAGFIALLLLSGTVIFTVQHQYWSDDDELSVEEAFQDRIEEFLFSGRPSTFTAPEVAALLTDGYSGNDPHIISLRNRSMYELGHIPGAVNVPAGDIFTESHFESLPRNRLIIVYDDTGHQSAEIASLMNVMGLFAVSLEWGMASWTANYTIAPGIVSSYQQILNNHTIVTGSEPGVFTRTSFMQYVGQCGFVTPPPPDVDEDNEKALREAIHSMVRSRTTSSPSSSSPTIRSSSTISSMDLESSLTSSTPLNDPFVLDIRSPPRYQKGHIPGAINNDVDTMFWSREFDVLPEDGRTIVVVGDTPHQTSRASAYLGIIGYPTISLEYGMASWTNDPDVPTITFDQTRDIHNLPVSQGPDSGSYDTATVRGLTEEEILLKAAYSFGRLGMAPMNVSDLHDLINGNGRGWTIGPWSGIRDRPVTSEDFITIGLPDGNGTFTSIIESSWDTSSDSIFTRSYLTDLVRDGRPVLIYDADGPQARIVATFLNLLGFNATSLQFGLCSWTNDTIAVPQPFNHANRTELPVETMGQPYPILPGLPDGLSLTVPDLYSREWDILREAFHALLTESGHQDRAIGRDSLYYDMIDDQTTNDPLLYSFRWLRNGSGPRPPGTSFTMIELLLQPGLLDNLRTAGRVVLISDDGEFAAVTSAMLRLNGFDSSYLRYGFDSWQYNATTTDDPNPCVDPSARVNAYPILS